MAKLDASNSYLFFKWDFTTHVGSLEHENVLLNLPLPPLLLPLWSVTVMWFHETLGFLQAFSEDQRIGNPGVVVYVRINLKQLRYLESCIPGFYTMKAKFEAIWFSRSHWTLGAKTPITKESTRMRHASIWITRMYRYAYASKYINMIFSIAALCQSSTKLGTQTRRVHHYACYAPHGWPGAPLRAEPLIVPLYLLSTWLILILEHNGP